MLNIMHPHGKIICKRLRFVKVIINYIYIVAINSNLVLVKISRASSKVRYRSQLIVFYSLRQDLILLDEIHSKLQEQFENFLADTLKLEDKYKKEILKRDMGQAGKIEGKSIISTKIPKSDYIKEWLNETDPSKKRAIFCHCPRIRSVLDNPEKAKYVKLFTMLTYHHKMYNT